MKKKDTQREITVSGRVNLRRRLPIVGGILVFISHLHRVQSSLYSSSQKSENMHPLTVVVLSVAIVQLSFACYITNCPIGGKRSLLFKTDHATHECPRCGVNGQCYGPSICCTSFGCRIGHPLDARQCATENRSLVPCSIKSAACTAVPHGRCAASGVCCSTEACQLDDSCSLPANQDDELPNLSA